MVNLLFPTIWLMTSKTSCFFMLILLFTPAYCCQQSIISWGSAHAINHSAIDDNMPKVNKTSSLFYGCACPNPHCNSRVFQTLKQLRMHVGAKPQCLQYLIDKRSDEITDSKSHDNTALMPASTNVMETAPHETTNESPMEYNHQNVLPLTKRTRRTRE